MGRAYGRLLRVNLSTGEIKKIQLDPDMLKQYVGSTGVGVRLLWDEMPAGADPLGEEAKVVFATGPIAGTLVPSGGSYEVCFKSPATGTWCESRSGGRFGPVLRYAGYDFLVIEGTAKDPVYIDIDEQTVAIKDAGTLWGLDVEKTTDALVGKAVGTDVSVACIGPAGEKGVLFAALMNDRGRAAGRGGIGAVLGSKHLKAIRVKGRGQISVADPDALKSAVEEAEEAMKKYPFQSIPEAGTIGLVAFNNSLGFLPTRNFKAGKFDKHEAISGERFNREYNIKRRGCYGCLLSCGRYSDVKGGKWSTPAMEGPEYETADMLGANCMVSDLEAVIRANYLCNIYGLDTVSTGSAVCFAFEAYEKGLITKDETEGVELSWGNADAMIYLVEKIARREGIGELLSLGVKRAAEKLGQGAENFAIHVKGLEAPAHEPRSESKLLAIQYAVSPRGACHMHPNWASTWDFNLDLGMGSLGLEMPPEQPGEESFRKGGGYSKVALAGEISEILGACVFYSWGVEGICITPRLYTQMLNALLGWDMTTDELVRSADRSWTLKRAFNIREGFDRKDDVLPKRFTEVLEDGPVEGCTVAKLDEMIDGYYEALGWDKEKGWPTTEKLTDLGLEDVAEKLYR